MVERGRGKGESDVDLTGDSSDAEEEEMFEAQRVTVGELTKCDERIYWICRVVQRFYKRGQALREEVLFEAQRTCFS